MTQDLLVVKNTIVVGGFEEDEIAESKGSNVEVEGNRNP